MPFGPLAMLLVDPVGLGGAVIRDRAGPARDAALRALDPLGPFLRVPPTATDDALFGGLDLAATLAAGRAVERCGLLSRDGPLLIPGAERIPRGLAGRLASAMEGRATVALDEGIDEEKAPAPIAERVAFRIEPDGERVDMAAVIEARARLAGTAVSDADRTAVAALTLRLGISSARAARFALCAACAHAALRGRGVEEEDLRAAVAAVLAHRATVLPTPEPEGAPPPEPTGASDPSEGTAPEDMLIDAVRAALPAGLLDRLASRAARGTGSGSGTKRIGNRRGRPLPSRPGRPDGRARIDIVATLRAAAPWQRMRGGGRLRINRGDIHLRRHETHSDRLLIFAVDASGSSAMARLSEAKGAVEMLLSDAYARRDHVALVAFRGEGAELLLPPTRSLARTKKRLAALPGGGGTPLASGIETALALALTSRSRGLAPTLVLLTDGRANVGLGGVPGRARAAEDAGRMARAARAQGLDALVIDTGRRPERALRDLAAEMGGAYLAMPRADAARLSGAVSASLG